MPTPTNITERLQERLMSLSPTSLTVIDDSKRHAGHVAVRGLPSGETHFVVKIGWITTGAAPSRVALHRQVYQAVGDLMNNPIHALNIEWVPPQNPASPATH